MTITSLKIILLILCFEVNDSTAYRIPWDKMVSSLDSQNTQIDKELIRYKMDSEFAGVYNTKKVDDFPSNELNLCSANDVDCYQYESNNSLARNNAEVKPNENFSDPIVRDICDGYKKYGDHGGSAVDENTKENIKDMCKQYETNLPRIHQNFDKDFDKQVEPEHCNLIGLDDDEGGGYVLDVIVGTPGQKLKLLIDTTSAYLAVIESSVFNNSLHFRRNGSSSLLNESYAVDEVLRFGTWRGHVSTDVVSFPEVNFDEEFRSKVVLINETRKLLHPNAKFHGILGLSYPKDLHWKPFSYSNAWIDSMQRAVPEKDVAVLLEFCGTTHLNKLVQRCGFFDILENNLDREAEVARLGMLVTKTESEWTHDFKLLGVQIETELLKIHNEESRRTQIDTTTIDIHIPTEIFTRFVLLMILKTEFPVDDSFWYGGDDRCWKDMMSKFPRVQFRIEYDRNAYFVLSIPPQNYLRPVAKENVSEICYRFAFQASSNGNFFGIAALEGFQVILGRKGLGLVKSPHCGPETEMWGPTTLKNETDRIYKFLGKDRIETISIVSIFILDLGRKRTFQYLFWKLAENI